MLELNVRIFLTVMYTFEQRLFIERWYEHCFGTGNCVTSNSMEPFPEESCTKGEVRSVVKCPRPTIFQESVFTLWHISNWKRQGASLLKFETAKQRFEAKYASFENIKFPRSNYQINTEFRDITNGYWLYCSSLNFSSARQFKNHIELFSTSLDESR